MSIFFLFLLLYLTIAMLISWEWEYDIPCPLGISLLWGPLLLVYVVVVAKQLFDKEK